MIHAAGDLRQTASRALAACLKCLLASCVLVSGCNEPDSKSQSQSIDNVRMQDRRGTTLDTSVGAPTTQPLLRRGAYRADAAMRGLVNLAWDSKSVPDDAVRAGVLELARRSTEQPRVHVHAQDRGSLSFAGRVPNDFGHDVPAARAFIEAWFASLALGPGVSLRERRSDVGEAGDVHLIYDLSLRNPRLGGPPLPVWNADLGAHFAADASLTSLNAAGLQPISARGDIRFDAAAARGIVKHALSTDAAHGRIEDGGAAVRLGVWLRDFGDARASVLAWRVESAYASDGGPRQLVSYVDASSGAIVAHQPLTHAQVATPTLGSALDYGGRAVVLQISYYAGAATYGLFDQSAPARGRILTYDAQNAAPDAQTSVRLVASASPTSWDRGAATAHHNARTVLDYFATLGRNSWDGQGGDLNVVVHVGVNWANATFTSSPTPILRFGDGNGAVLETPRCLDVMAHEVSHGVVATTSDLIYTGESGALNESFADVFAAMVDRDDWTIGEACSGPGLGYFRSLQTPSLRGQPGHMRDFKDLPLDQANDWGGVHFNSGIPNRAAFLLADARGREKLEQIWYRTLQAGHLSQTASFAQMALATLRACTELSIAARATSADCRALAMAWREVGIAVLDPAVAGACPADATATNGLCACNTGSAPSEDGSACIPLAQAQCPVDAALVEGECHCQEGFVNVGGVCRSDPSLCPPNSRYDAVQQACVCSPGFEGDPFAREGGCQAVPSSCPANAHPVWTGDPVTQPADYQCVCNDNHQLDASTNTCVIVPGTCGGETLYGRCVGATLVYCDAAEIEMLNCATNGFVCGRVDTRIGNDCLNPAGAGPAGACSPAETGVCDDANPICVGVPAGADGASTGFCSVACDSDLDCGAPFGCCGSLKSGSRACLTADHCDAAEDPRPSCGDVAGGSTFTGSCTGDVLVYCDPSTRTTLQVDCSLTGRTCGFESAESGFNCVEAAGTGTGGEAGLDSCPSRNDGSCDVPARCPEGSDVRDCHPCGTVPASGVCDGTTLRLCHPELGLVTSDCAQSPTTTTCGVVVGVAACRAPELALSAVDDELPSLAPAPSDVSCSASARVGSGWWMLALLGMLARRRGAALRRASRAV